MVKNKIKFFDTTNRSRLPFQIFCGQRGVGKTYPTLREVRDGNTNFIYLRNSEAELKTAMCEVGNAFKKINKDFGTDIHPRFNSETGLGEWWEHYGEYNTKQKERTKEPKRIGYGAAISTIAKARSIDLSDLDEIIFEEVIPEEHVKQMRGRGKAFLNFYETAARNRELEGKAPIKVFMLCNAIRISDDVLIQIGASKEIEDMIRRGELRRSIPDRNLYIELVENKEYADMKKNTALYKLGNTQFNSESLTATFVNDHLELIQPKFNRNQYTLLLSFGDIAIYRNNANEEMYARFNGERGAVNLKGSETARLKMIIGLRYTKLVQSGRFKFDSIFTKNILDNALRIDL